MKNRKWILCNYDTIDMFLNVIKIQRKEKYREWYGEMRNEELFDEKKSLPSETWCIYEGYGMDYVFHNDYRTCIVW